MYVRFIKYNIFYWLLAKKNVTKGQTQELFQIKPNCCNIKTPWEHWLQDAKDKFKDVNAPVKHKVEERKWEKGLQQVFGETNADKLITEAKEELTKYFAALPKPSEYLL